MVVILQGKIKSIRAVRDFHSANLAFLRQNPQIPVDSSLADVGVILSNKFKHLFGGNMTLHGTDGFQHQISLYGIASFHRASLLGMILYNYNILHE